MMIIVFLTLKESPVSVHPPNSGGTVPTRIQKEEREVCHILVTWAAILINIAAQQRHQDILRKTGIQRTQSAG